MRAIDRDLNKLKKFVRSFGLKLSFRPYTRYTDLAHYISGESITIFTNKRTSKREIALSLMHELGHHLDWIINKRTDKDTEKAYTEFGASEFKKYTKIILNIEKAGIRHMTSIHSILDLEMPVALVRQQQKLDIFHYKFHYKNRRYPTDREVIEFEKRIKYGKRKKRRI